MKDFLITGATGQLGRGILEQLLKRVQASSIAVLVRDPSATGSLASLGVEIRKGDYQDPASLESAFDGVEKLMFVSTTAFSDAITQHRNVVEAATRAGVRAAYSLHGRPTPRAFDICNVASDGMGKGDRKSFG